MNPLAGQASALLGVTVAESFDLQGGDLSTLCGLVCSDGKRIVAKAGPNARAEARMLASIAATGAPAPSVFGVEDELLLLEWLPHDGRLDQAWAALADTVRTLHASTGERYGWAEDFAFGRLAIPNGWLSDWPTFWAERRLLVGMASLPPELARRLELLAGQLPDRLPRQPRAALLHGDLWTGNLLVNAGAVSGLIDPACYYGDAEVDLAMLLLFGSPSASFYEQYGELAPGADEREPIYRLWPALVHLRLFGSGYRRMVEECLAALNV